MSERHSSSVEEVLSKLLEPEKVSLIENTVIQKELEEELNNLKIAQSMARFCICIGRQKNGEQGCISAIGVLLPILVETVNTNIDVTFVNEALESIVKLLTELKGLVLKTEGHLSSVHNCVKNVINKATQCQIKDDNSVDHDETIMENAGNILYALGFAMTPKEFAPYFAELLPSILQRAKKESSLSEKAFSVGVLATCIKPLDGFLGPFVTELHTTFAALVLEEEIDLRTNAIFGIGELVLYGREDSYRYYPQILQMLVEVALREDDRYVLDNICGAFARLILTNKPVIPMDEVFPILMKHLPLGEDFVENTTLLKCFVFLLKTKDEQFHLHLSQVLTVLDTMFSNAFLQPEQKVVAGVLVMDIQTKFPSEYQNWIREKMKQQKE